MNYNILKSLNLFSVSTDISQARDGVGNDGSALYRVYVDVDGTEKSFTLRTSNSTGNDWTIDFGKNYVGPYKGVKFWK